MKLLRSFKFKNENKEKWSSAAPTRPAPLGLTAEGGRREEGHTQA